VRTLLADHVGDGAERAALGADLALHAHLHRVERVRYDRVDDAGGHAGREMHRRPRGGVRDAPREERLRGEGRGVSD